MEPGSTPAVTISELEAAIAEIGEVRAARIVASPDGRIEEIHILGLPGQEPQAARPRRRVLPHGGLRGRCGRRMISIAQIGLAEERPRRRRGPASALHRRGPRARAGAGARSRKRSRGHGYGSPTWTPTATRCGRPSGCAWKREGEEVVRRIERTGRQLHPAANGRRGDTARDRTAERGSRRATPWRTAASRCWVAGRWPSAVSLPLRPRGKRPSQGRRWFGTRPRVPP